MVIEDVEISNRNLSNSMYEFSIDPSSGGTTYSLTSDPRCLRQACSVILKHNGTLATDVGGCLSFALRIRGQPGKETSFLDVIHIHEKSFS